MGTTKEDIRSWLERGKAEGATHCIVVCDTYEYEDYPVYVKEGEDPLKRATEYDGKNMQQVMEVYNLAMDIDLQLSEYRARNY